MIRAARVIPAVLAAVGLLLTGQASHASTVSDSSARTSARADAFYCVGGGPTFQVVNRITFGGAGWIQETGLRSDGARAVRVYHPTGRNDEYRWRFSNGETHFYSFSSSSCVMLGSGGAIRPEARNGGQWWEGQWRSA